jgi:hypothetical protein
MFAEAHHDGMLRIFDKDGKMICDMVFSPPLKINADEQLKRLKLRRRGPWKDYNWGSEARVRFNR